MYADGKNAALSYERGGLALEECISRAWSLLPEPPRWRGRLAVSLSVAWARPFWVGPMSGLRNRSELMAWARAECGAKLSAPWRTEAHLWIDAWSKSGGALAVATHPEVGVALKLQAKITGWRLVSLGPWWVSRASDYSPQPSNELLVAECSDGIAWLVGDQNSINGVGAWCPTPDAETLDALRRRLQLQYQVSLVRHVFWTDDWPAPT